MAMPWYHTRAKAEAYGIVYGLEPTLFCIV
jgi:hypothetical protein